MTAGVLERTVLPEQTVLEDVEAIESAARALLQALVPEAVYLHDASRVFAAFDRVERLCTAGKTLMAPRVELASTWRRGGYRSPAEELAEITGGSISSARAMLATAKQLDDLPDTAAAMRSGALSMPKVEAIASSATIAPDAEASLLQGAATQPLAQVREKGLRARARDRDATYARLRTQRSARDHVDAEGAWNFYARGTVDDAARFRAAHEPIVDEMFRAARAEGRTESRDAYAFDALIEMGRRAAAPGEGGAAKPAAPRFMALLRVDHEALRRGAVEGDEVCEIAGLGPIPVPVARDLLGDAILKLVITKGVDVLNVTHLGRSPTAAQQVALWWRAPECTAEGCTRTRRLENDHEIGWAETQRTRVDELDPLCTHEHALKTNRGWALVRGTGKRPFVPPDDPRHPEYRAPPDPGGS